MTNPTMFFSQPTVIDHAYIDQEGRVVGGSFNPDFLVTGEIDPKEKVVIDFGTGKKQIKALIDHKEFGYDHKLWIIPGFSNAEYDRLENDRIKITTPVCELGGPIDMIRVCEVARDYSTAEIGQELQAFLTRELGKQHPGIKVEVHNSTTAHVFRDARPMVFFRYVHGLKNSTSWGCQQPSHGHLSFLQAEPEVWEPFDVGMGTGGQIEALLHQIRKAVDNAIFVWDENIDFNKSNGEWIAIDYTTAARGRFTCKYLNSAFNIVVLPHETTVELLAEYIEERWGPELQKAGVKQLFVSEGLSKGAVICL